MSHSEAKDFIHISEIDEYLASRLMKEGVDQLSFKVGKSGEDGFISLSPVEIRDTGDQDPLDFELSPSEYHSLNDTELQDLLSSSLVTSSALELFDFLLLRTKGFTCVVEFTGGAWKMKITELQ